MQFESDPDPAWVAELTGSSVAAAQRALAEVARDVRLFRSIRRQHLRGGRSHYVEIDAPFELHAIARMNRPRTVVEVGVSSGVSSAYLLRALARNRRGRLHSIDLPRREPPHRSDPTRGSWTLPAGRASGWAIPAGLRDRWSLHLGNKAVELPRLAADLDRIDLFVYDVPHDDSNCGREFRAVDHRLPVGGVAIVDHGPGGGRCPVLARWARRRGAAPAGRRGLGLYGFRAARRAQRPGAG